MPGSFSLAFQCLDIGKILHSPRRFLVGDEVFPGEHGNILIFKPRRKSANPRVIEPNAIDLREYVNTHGRNANLKNETRLGEIVLGELIDWRPERRESA